MQPFIIIAGSVEGICLVEAGYFENGGLREKVKINPTRAFRRMNFSFRGRPDQRPEVRVYNVLGDSDSLPADGRYP